MTYKDGVINHDINSDTFKNLIRNKIKIIQVNGNVDLSDIEEINDDSLDHVIAVFGDLDLRNIKKLSEKSLSKIKSVHGNLTLHKLEILPEKCLNQLLLVDGLFLNNVGNINNQLNNITDINSCTLKFVYEIIYICTHSNINNNLYTAINPRTRTHYDDFINSVFNIPAIPRVDFGFNGDKLSSLTAVLHSKVKNLVYMSQDFEKHKLF